MKVKYWLILVLFVTTGVNMLMVVNNKPVVQEEQVYVDPIVPPYEEPKEEKPNITTSIPDRQFTYEEVNMLLDEWHKSAPEITEVGVVGETFRGRPIRYIRIGKKSGPKVLITAAIHGNEKLSTMAMLGAFNNILKAYMGDEKVTEILTTRDIYFIPIVSPEGYISNTRYTMGLDPNRNFSGKNLQPKNSIPCVHALKMFHNKHKFNAVMSCHNYGTVYFYPWGYTRNHTHWDSKYRELLSKMAKLSGYNYVQLYRQSGPPYYGYELDWFHQNGAFAVVNEIGTRFEAHKSEIEKETNRNYESLLLFITEAPLARQ